MITASRVVQAAKDLGFSYREFFKGEPGLFLVEQYAKYKPFDMDAMLPPEGLVAVPREPGIEFAAIAWSRDESRNDIYVMHLVWREDTTAYNMESNSFRWLAQHYEDHATDGCHVCGALTSLLMAWSTISHAYAAWEDEPVYGTRHNRRRGQSRTERLGTVRTLRLDAVRRYEQQAHQGGTHESPCRHWVRPFKRRLKNGRVVPVRGHYRGVGAPAVPTVRVA